MTGGLDRAAQRLRARCGKIAGRQAVIDPPVDLGAGDHLLAACDLRVAFDEDRPAALGIGFAAIAAQLHQVRAACEVFARCGGRCLGGLGCRNRRGRRRGSRRDRLDHRCAGETCSGRRFGRGLRRGRGLRIRLGKGAVEFGRDRIARAHRSVERGERTCHSAGSKQIDRRKFARDRARGSGCCGSLCEHLIRIRSAAQRQLRGHAGIGLRLHAEQVGDAGGVVFRPGDARPFGNARIQFTRGDVFCGDDPRGGPVAAQRVGIGEVLAHGRSILPATQRILHDLCAQFGIARQRIGEAQIRRSDRIAPFAQRLDRGAVVAQCDRGECIAQRGARAHIAQHQRLFERLLCGCEAARREVGGAELCLCRRIIRRGEHGLFGQGDCLFGIAVGAGRGGIAGRCGFRTADAAGAAGQAERGQRGGKHQGFGKVLADHRFIPPCGGAIGRGRQAVRARVWRRTWRPPLR